MNNWKAYCGDKAFYKKIKPQYDKFIDSIEQRYLHDYELDQVRIDSLIQFMYDGNVEFDSDNSQKIIKFRRDRKKV